MTEVFGSSLKEGKERRRNRAGVGGEERSNPLNKAIQSRGRNPDIPFLSPKIIHFFSGQAPFKKDRWEKTDK